MGSVHSIPLHELELISFLTIPTKNVAIARIVADYFFWATPGNKWPTYRETVRLDGSFYEVEISARV